MAGPATTLPTDRLTLPFPWEQGQHMAVVGTTGTGKSTLMSRLVLSRDNSIVFRTKPDDVKWPGKLIRKAEGMEDPRLDRIILAPNYDNQAGEIRDAFNRAWLHKGWLVVVDELFYVQDYLGIKREVDRQLTQGRSKGLTMMMGMQRPVGVTRFGLSQSSHILSFHQDGRDARTLRDAAGLPPEVEKRLGQLLPHQFLWYCVPARKFWVGYVQDLEPSRKRAKELAGA